MTGDAVDDILEQWASERPELAAGALGVVLRVMSLSRSFAREAARALAPVGLELHEYDALAALRRQGEPFELAATALAAETGLSSGAMTNRIDRLEQRGLVRRRADPADRRGVNVSLTAAGQRVIDEAIRLRLAAAEASLGGLSGDEQRRLADLLRKLVLRAAGGDD